MSSQFLRIFLVVKGDRLTRVCYKGVRLRPRINEAYGCWAGLSTMVLSIIRNLQATGLFQPVLEDG
jgi:hypothetical protein